MDEQEEILQNNMISNLPLLFANGYPTSLDKISESQLERFIPFMVQCSLGHINLQGQVDCSEPEWWPEDLPFNIPFSKPKKFAGNWIQKLKEVVLICYQFHKSVFLLRFCNDLSSYEHASLRFINNYNSTTSLFDRRSNKLLVTFRNENMSYDQPQRLRKCLLQQKAKPGNNRLNTLHQMVEPAPFDIYLCDNCDAELYSKEAILEHEKACIVEDDDVILCDTPELCDSQLIDKDNLEDSKQRIGFLLNFNLQYKCNNKSSENKEGDDGCISSNKSQNESQFMIIDKKKRISRRSRTVHLASRCPTIPLSSPAGQLLLRSTKTVLTSSYLIERLERTERFCHAPLVSKSTVRPKLFEKRNPTFTPHCTFKKPQEYSSHLYVFPRRQYSQKRRMDNILLINSTLLRRCRPISVRLKKIADINTKLSPSSSNKLNIKLTRDNSRSSNWKISSFPSNEIIVDTIDLCTSDEEDNQNNFCSSNLSSHIAKSSLDLKTIDNKNNKFSQNSLALHTSVSDIEQQLSLSVESSLYDNSLKNLHTGIENYNSTSCLMKVVNNNENSSLASDDGKNTETFRPSLYILSSNCSSKMSETKSQNLKRNNNESSEVFKKSKSLPNNITDVPGNWIVSEQNVNLISNIEDNLIENKDLTNPNTLTEQSHTLPLLLHKNRIISIDLTS